jgi:bacillopeptidase F
MAQLLNFLVLITLFTTSQAAQIDPALLNQNVKKVTVVALLSPNCIASATVANIKTLSAACARAVARKTQLKNFRSLWISHAMAAEVSKTQLTALSANPSVTKIYFNHQFTFENSVVDYNNLYQPPYSFAQIHLDLVHASYPNLDGQNQTIGLIDTGVDGDHEELKGKVEKFFDAEKNQLTQSNDPAGHGTHVAGILTATSFGVAPQAKIVAAKMLNIESAIRAMQFMAEQKNIRVVNNSWGEQDLPDIEVYYRALNVWEKLNIIPVFSAGNAGPKENTLTHPKEHPSTIVVGSSNRDGTVSNTSSRGPGLFNGLFLPKPEIIAPGEKIISTLPGNRLGEWSGASMAAPLVTGTIALMLQINSDLTTQQIRQTLISTAQEYANGWQSDRGFGILDAFKAVSSTPVQPATPVTGTMLSLEQKDIFYFPGELQGTTWR